MRLFLRAATFVAVVSWPTVWNGSVAVIAPGVVREAPGVMVLSSSGVLANGLFDLPDRMRQTLLFVFGAALLVSRFIVLAGMSRRVE
jgi:hypothetical protein